MALPFLVTSSSTARRRAGPQRPLDRRHPPAFRHVPLALGGAKVPRHRRGDARARPCQPDDGFHQLHQQLLARQAGGPITVTVLAPANWEVQNPHEGTEPAWRRLRAARKHLQAGETSDGQCWMSSGVSSGEVGEDGSVDLAREVALQAPHDVLLGHIAQRRGTPGCSTLNWIPGRCRSAGW
jgi:hypothetical protein